VSRAAEGSFDRTLNVTGPVELDVTTGSGTIHVRAGDSSTVRVHATLRSHNGWGGNDRAEDRVHYLEQHPPIEQDGNTIRIGHIEDRELTRNISISYDLVVPADTRLAAQTGSGDQTIGGIRGPLKASTGSGSLRISDIGDEVRANTGSGDIQLDAIKGGVSANTGSGTIRARGVAGEFVGETGSGNVHLEQTAPGRVKVTSGSGSVDLNGVRGALRVEAGSGNIRAQGEATGDWRLDTGSGGITVRLPSNAAFDLHAHTSSGSISTDHHVTILGTVSRSDWRGKARGGGFLLDVRTGSGDIRIE
ncbi:MAG: DUF4097 family beta strand repeat-containing protein, partial [Thermoplasmata archaeon]